MNKDREHQLIFSLRKLSVGLASVAIATTFLMIGTPQKAHAAELNTTEKTELQQKSTSNASAAIELNTVAVQTSKAPEQQIQAQEAIAPATNMPTKQEQSENTKAQTVKATEADTQQKSEKTNAETSILTQDSVEKVDNHTVKIEHKQITVDPNDPKKPTDKLPDVPGNFPSGVDTDDLNKTVTRTIDVTDPDGTKHEHTDSAKLQRSATVDEITKEVKYSDWSTGTFDKFTTPEIDGYTPSQNEVPATEVTSDMTDQTIDISYTANSQTIHINYVDGAGEIVHTTTITGKTGETVNLSLTVPDKYQLADGQQLPTTYTFTAGSGDVTIHLAHKVVQREATIDVQIGLVTLVDFNIDEPGIVVTQNQWRQLDDEIKKSYTTYLEKVNPSVGVVGTLTGHVNYDLVDNKVVSFEDDWTSLNLGGQTYQMPNGTDVVNGVVLNNSAIWGKKLKEVLLKAYPDTDPDYATRPWHGYLSVNKSDIDPDYSGFRLVGNESNTLVKATGDRAATAIEMTNKPIDLSSLLESGIGSGLSDFNEQDGQLRAKAIFPVGGIYIPYVEKTVTRTINVTTPDGKTTSVKQTATLAKQVEQVDVDKDAHPDWTTGEWTSYDVPTIPGYTASRSNVAKEVVTGVTKDQTVNITYTANPQTTHIKYVDGEGNVIKTDTVSGKTDQTVKTNSSVPTGWVVDGDQQVPSEITLKGASTPDTVVKIKHGTVEVDHDKPAKKGDPIPGSDNKTYPDGLTDTDLNSKGVRKIVFDWPASYDPTTSGLTFDQGSNNTITQTVNFYRDAVLDTVTGQIVGYKVNGKVVPADQGWVAIGDGNYPAVKVPDIAGYTCKVESSPIKSDGLNSFQLFTVSFVAKPSTKPGDDDHKPTDPSKPGDKDHPSNPDDHGHQTDPGDDNTPTTPTKPDDQPSDHQQPTNPTNPSENTEPSGQPTQPNEPTDQNQNTDEGQVVIIPSEPAKQPADQSTVSEQNSGLVNAASGNNNEFVSTVQPVANGFSANVSTNNSGKPALATANRLPQTGEAKTTAAVVLATIAAGLAAILAFFKAPLKNKKNK